MNQSTSNQIPTNQFLLKENIQMLWDIVSDKDSSPQVEQMFRQIVFEFNEREKRAHPNLMAMNKYFITTFVTLLNTMRNGKRKYTPGINGVPQNGVPVTQEQWQEQRKSQFDKELATMKQDLAAVLQPSLPDKPKFTEDIDSPMDDRVMKEMMAQREREYDAYKPAVKPATTATASSENRIQNVLKELEKLVQPEKVSIRIEDTLGTEVTKGLVVEELAPLSSPLTSTSFNASFNASLNSASLNSASLNSASLTKKHIHWGENEERSIAPLNDPLFTPLYDMLNKQQTQIDSLVRMITEIYELRKESK